MHILLSGNSHGSCACAGLKWAVAIWRVLLAGSVRVLLPTLKGLRRILASHQPFISRQQVLAADAVGNRRSGVAVQTALKTPCSTVQFRAIQQAGRGAAAFTWCRKSLPAGLNVGSPSETVWAKVAAAHRGLCYHQCLHCQQTARHQRVILTCSFVSDGAIHT